MTEIKHEFICGSAGTGKTFLARQRVKDITRGAVLTATTGIAAINLGDAVTISSLLKYFDTKTLHAKFSDGTLDNRLTDLSVKGFGSTPAVKEIIIDEISMLSAAQLDILFSAIDTYNAYCKKGRQIALTLVGDFAQLPPINEKFAFEATCWHIFENNTIKLRKIHRQKDNDFVDALIAARNGSGGVVADFFKGNYSRESDQEFDGTTIMGRNNDVDIFNYERLQSIPRNKVLFHTLREKKQMSEWKNIPDILELKPTALVMILANAYEGDEIIYANGDLGRLVEKVDDNKAIVRVLRTGELVTVNSVYRKNQEVIKEKLRTVGAIKYMPLRLAWATSVHKSQGLTLDKIQINIRNPFMKHPGMLYVALSRARNKEGIRIVGTPELMRSRCTVDERVRRWL